MPLFYKWVETAGSETGQQRHRDAGGRGGKICILNRCVQCEKTEAYYVCMTMSSIFFCIVSLSIIRIYFFCFLPSCEPMLWTWTATRLRTLSICTSLSSIWMTTDPSSKTRSTMALWMKARNQVINDRWIKTTDTITIEAFFCFKSQEIYGRTEKEQRVYQERLVLLKVWLHQWIFDATENFPFPLI